jgi:hypothetical protein
VKAQKQYPNCIQIKTGIYQNSMQEITYVFVYWAHNLTSAICLLYRQYCDGLHTIPVRLDKNTDCELKISEIGILFFYFFRKRFFKNKDSGNG